MITDDVKTVLFEKSEIEARISEMAAELAREVDWRKPTAMVVILKGAMVFAASLLQRLPMPLELVTVLSSSYQGKTTKPTGKPAVLVPPRFASQVEGKQLIVVDDILDHGHTLDQVWGQIFKYGGRHIRTAVLLRKRNRPNQPAVQHVGFDIPDEFVVGYGLDYNELYRNLPDIVVLKPEVYS